MSYLPIQDIQNLGHGDLVPARTAHRTEQALSDLVGARHAKAMLSNVGVEGLRRWPSRELSVACGVPLRLTRRVVAAREMFLSLPTAVPSCSTAFRLLEYLPSGLAALEYEVLLALALGANLDPRAIVVISKGGGTGAAVNARDVFVSMVRHGASAVVLVHNHPSGNPTPSERDVEFTNKVAAAGRILDIALVDHLIVALGGWVSFYELGLLPTEDELSGSQPRA